MQTRAGGCDKFLERMLKKLALVYKKFSILRVPHRSEKGSLHHSRLDIVLCGANGAFLHVCRTSVYGIITNKTWGPRELTQQPVVGKRLIAVWLNHRCAVGGCGSTVGT